MIDGASFPQLLNWINAMTPLTRAELNSLAQKGRDYSGVRLAYAAHIEPKMISHIEFFIRHGMQFLVSPCVPGIVSTESFEHLERIGAKVFGLNSRTWQDLEGEWTKMLSKSPTHIFDIGGGLIAKAVDLSVPVRVACEATSTGIARVKNLRLSFPVYDWNDIPYKNLMHNRYEVGPGIWYAFRKLTGLDLCRMKVGVIGFGLVGHGVATIARGMGAQTFVCDRTPIRQLEAASEGFSVCGLDTLLAKVDVIATATGVQETLVAAHLQHARDGIILLNAGHDSREINLPSQSKVADILPGVAEYQLGGKKVYLLAQGRLLNLAAGGGSGINTFDLMTALIAIGIDFIAQPATFEKSSPGLHLLPDELISDLQKAAVQSCIQH